MIKLIKKIIRIIIAILPAIIIVCSNTTAYAANLNLSTYAWYFYNGSTEQWSSEWTEYGSPNRSGYNLQLGPANNLRYIRVRTNSVTPSGNYAAVNFKFNVVFAVPHNYGRRWQFRPDLIDITSSNIGSNSYIPQNKSISTVRTDWEEWNGTQYCTQSNPCDMTTYTIMGSYYLSNIDQTAGQLQITIGGTTPFWESTPDQYNSTRVYLESTTMSIDFTTTIDNSLLQYQITQNDIIINQNQATQNKMVEGFEQVNDTLTDSTVTGNFNVTSLQPFGPIGAITNGILQIPATIMNLNPCTPITPELPYIGENINIPCPSTVLNAMAGDFMTWIDVIASAGIWFIVAKYIFKKVQNLRDPTNEDEEYLEL